MIPFYNFSIKYLSHYVFLLDIDVVKNSLEAHVLVRHFIKFCFCFDQ